MAPEFSPDAEGTDPSSPHAAVPGAAFASADSTPRVMWLMSDLLLVGLVAVLAIVAAITAVRQDQHRRNRDRVVDGLTAAAAAFQAYMQEHKKAPAGADVGVVPEGMAPYLTGVDWLAPTPVGGGYRWINIAANGPGGAPSAGGIIAITAFPPSPPLTLSTADLLKIDRRIDDGNLATGSFRTGFNGWPVLSVRARPASP